MAVGSGGSEFRVQRVFEVGPLSSPTHSILGPPGLLYRGIHELAVLGRLSDEPLTWFFDPKRPNLKLFRRGAVFSIGDSGTVSSFSSSGGVGGMGGASGTSGIGVIESEALNGGVRTLWFGSGVDADALRLPMDCESC